MTVTDPFSPHYVYKRPVKEYQKVVADPSGDEKLSDARDIGNLRLNHSRLNLVSSLDPKDNTDIYKFTMVSPGPVRLGTGAIPDTLRVEVMDAKGKVIASNDENGDKAAYEKFMRMADDGDNGWARGDYYVKISRTDASDAKEKYSYAFQLQSGDDRFTHDYETIEQSFNPAKASSRSNPVDPVTEAMAKASVSGRLAASQAAASLLVDGYSNMQTIFDSYLASKGWGNGGGGFFA